jgi:iron(III) transport system substrate-binding protein
VLLNKRISLIVLVVLALSACTQATPAASPEASASPESSALPEASGSPEAQSTLDADAELIVYSGRTETLIGPIIERFEEETGISVGVRYGDTAEMAATILEEGQNSPADVYIAQDAGALGALQNEGLLAPLADDILNRVDARFRSPDGVWVGLSGRARVVAYNLENVTPDDLPDSIHGFTEPEWSGRIGWAPTNGSFQAFVTALRVAEGDDAAHAWLEGIMANDPVVYPNNATALQGVAAGEVDVAFINHYYLFQALKEEGDDFNAANYFLPAGDPGSLVNVAGGAILNTSEHPDVAAQFIAFLLGEEAQHYFAEETFEYPLIEGIAIDPRLPALADIETPDIDLSDLSDLQGTLLMLQDVGALE